MFKAKKFVVVMLVVVGMMALSCKGQTNKFTTVSPSAFKDQLEKQPDAQLIDVRTPEEYRSQHIENAVNLNIGSEQFANGIATLDKSKPVYVYCLSGGRSKKAAKQLTDLGFNEVIELDGGIMKWNAAGLADDSAVVGGMSVGEYEALIKSDKPVLVNFYADWCAPCKRMAPYIKKLQADKTAKVGIVRLNADEHKSLLKNLQITELPGLLLYHDGKLSWSHTGYISESDLLSKL